MKNKKQLFVVILLSVLLLVVARYCIHTDGPYKGKVVELDTGRPIEGAVVATSWSIETWINTWRFCDARETLTNKNGEFELPKGWCAKHPFAIMHLPEVTIFKSGYLGYPQTSFSSEIITITGKVFRDKDQYYLIELGKPKTRKERELTYDHAGFSDDESRQRLPILMRLLNEERRNLGLRGYEK